MILPNELRIGNWVISRDKATFVQVSDINGDDKKGINLNISWGYEDYNIIPFEELSGIPLTPEILEKCGFGGEQTYPCRFGGEPIDMNKHGVYSFYSGRNRYFVSTEGEVRLRLETSEVVIGHYKYLHQLQNLYYSLTGTEIEIHFN